LINTIDISVIRIKEMLREEEQYEQKTKQKILEENKKSSRKKVQGSIDESS
jgi:hypothetical protein